MFKVGEEVVLTEFNKLATITGFNNGLVQYRTNHGGGQCSKLNLKPRYEVKYLIIDNLDGGKSQLFDTEQQAFDIINKPRVNVGERWKHSDGTIVEVNRVDEEIVCVKFNQLGNLVFSYSYSANKFLEEFTKCES